MRVSGRVLLSLLLLVTTVTSILQAKDAYAAQITTRSLTLQANGSNGGSAPNVNVNHKFDFTLPSNSIGTIKFTYCTTASGSCTMPTGLVTNSGVTVSGLSGNLTGWTLVNTGGTAPNGAPYLTHSATPVSGATSATLVGVHNPTAANTTFFVRIQTYLATDGTGSAIDAGSVAASTTQVIVVTGTMPESLVFCTGATIPMNGTIPDCTGATAGNVTFNQLFSPTDTATATSQMAASTNATTGYVITLAGSQLTDGSHPIADAGASAVPVATGSEGRGTSHFGLNLVANSTTASTPAVGAAVDPVSNVGTDLRAQASTGFATADNFAYVSGGSTVAKSDYTSGGPFPTNLQRYTVSYFVNVAGSQAAGSYTATLTYVCTATF